MIAPAKVKRRVGRHLLPRLFNLAIAQIDQASQNQRLRARPAFGEPRVHKQLIGTNLGHQRTSAVSVAGVSSCGSTTASLPGAYQR